jgi:PhnB protein
MHALNDKPAPKTFASSIKRNFMSTADLITYLGFDGECEAAFTFYAKALNGEIVAMMRYADAPPDVPRMSERTSRIMHARLTVGDRSLMGGDTPSQHFSKPQGFCVAFQIDDPVEAERAFKALADGGQVTMPMGPTFFAQKFGMLTDKFGIPWMVNCPKPLA